MQFAMCQFRNYSNAERIFPKEMGVQKTKLACGVRYTKERNTSKDSTNLCDKKARNWRNTQLFSLHSSVCIRPRTLHTFLFSVPTNALGIRTQRAQVEWGKYPLFHSKSNIWHWSNFLMRSALKINHWLFSSHHVNKNQLRKNTHTTQKCEGNEIVTMCFTNGIHWFGYIYNDFRP